MKYLRSFFSTFFAALANGQVKIKNYYAARWLAKLAMNLAFEPYSYTMAHAVTAKTENIKKNYDLVLNNIESSLSYIDQTEEIQGFNEIIRMKAELVKLRENIQ